MVDSGYFSDVTIAPCLFMFMAKNGMVMNNILGKIP
jgi:hypothetical protein